METISKGDKNLEQSIEYVKRYLNGPLNHTMEDYILEKEYVAHKAGEKCGERRGERRGRKIGKKAGIIETAKNLLKLNIDMADIKKATGLTDEELKKLMD